MRALILGVTGQDGSYLADSLLERGHEVHGFIRHSASGNMKNIEHIKDRIKLHYGDLTDNNSIRDAIKNSDPDIIFNEADQDSAALSFKTPVYNYLVTGVAVGVILEAVRSINPKIKFFQPISSNVKDARSPYAVAKKFALELCLFYREVFGLDIYTCIFYNHVSPKQTEDYLLAKVINSLKRIKEGRQRELLLGDTMIRLDIGWAPEFMEIVLEKINKGIHDFEIGTGELYSVRELAEMACEIAGVNKNVIKTNASLLREARNPDFVCSDKVAKIHGRKLLELLYENTGI